MSCGPEKKAGCVHHPCSLASSLHTHAYTKICLHIRNMISVSVIVWNCHTHSLYAVTEGNTEHGLHYSFSVFTPIHTISRAIELQLPSCFGDAEMKSCWGGWFGLLLTYQFFPAEMRAEQTLWQPPALDDSTAVNTQHLSCISCPERWSVQLCEKELRAPDTDLCCGRVSQTVMLIMLIKKQSITDRL